MDTPKTPQAKRRANDKWDKEHMATLGCKVKKEEATAFKEYATKHGKTANTLLKEYVLQCIERNKQGGTLHSQSQDDNLGSV